MKRKSSWRNGIASQAAPDTALHYTESVVSYCESPARFPHRGNCRDDILPGLRVTNYRRRTVIAFVVRNQTVSILDVWHGGQDYEGNLLSDDSVLVTAVYECQRYFFFHAGEWKFLLL